MNNFKDFNIKPSLEYFTGDKIKIDRILNMPIVVTNFKVEPSKKKEGSDYLTLQIEKNGVKHVVFTGSTILIQLIQKVPQDRFPFVTTIVKEGEHLEFT
jgi:hypothetical protein